jgi:hypothetical protein
MDLQGLSPYTIGLLEAAETPSSTALTAMFPIQLSALRPILSLNPYIVISLYRYNIISI